MHRSEFAAEDSDQSPAKNKHFFEMDSQRLDSKTADGSNEQRFSSSVEPLSMYQNNRNGSVLPTNGQATSQINRPMFHYGYSPAGRNGNADKAWGQNPNAIEGQFTASFMTKWNAATYGKTSSHSNQLAITNGSDSPMKLQSDDSEDDYHFDELSECDPFNQLRRTLIANPKVRSQAKLQMHYSQAVPISPYVYSQAVPTVADLKSIPVWRRILNASHSEGSSNASLMSTGWKSTTHGHEKTDGDQFTSTGGQSLSDGTDSEQTFDELLKTESFNSMSVAQKVFMKAQKDRESERRQYLLMRNWKMGPRSPLLSRYSPEVLSEIDADSKEPHPMFTSTPRKMLNFDTSSSLNKSQQPSSKEELNGNSPRRDTPLDSLRELTATTSPSSMVDSARKDLSAFIATADEQKSTPSASVSTDTDRNAELQKPSTVNETQAESQPPKFIDSTTPTVSESIDAEKNSSPESPIDLDDSISVTATTASDALNEIIISEPSPSENCLNKPIGEEIFAKPQVPPVAFIQPMNIINEEIEERKIAPLDSVKNFDNSTVTTCVPASALIDHCYSISFIEEVTSPGSPAEFICPNGSIQQTIIWPPQTKEEICLSDSIANTPSASLSDVNEIFITVPADPSDKKRLPPTSSVISPNKKSSLEILNIIKKPTPKPKSAAKAPKRAYNRKNKIAVQSNELIKMAPPVGSTIGVPTNSLVPNQIISEQKMSNIPKNVQPIQMASKSSSNLPVKSETMPNPINPLKRNNPEMLQSHAPAKAKPPMAQNGPKANFSAASLKRTNKENLPIHIPAKVQKMEKIVTKKNIPLNLPDITVERVSNGQDAKNEAAIRGRKNSGVRSFLECIQSLQRNGVTVFNVPRKASTVQEELSQVRQKSSNQDIDKYMKALQKNNVSIKPVNKKISRN